MIYTSHEPFHANCTMNVYGMSYLTKILLKSICSIKHEKKICMHLDETSQTGSDDRCHLLEAILPAARDGLV